MALSHDEKLNLVSIFEVIPPGAAAIIITPSASSGVVPKNFISTNATIGKIINWDINPTKKSLGVFKVWH